MDNFSEIYSLYSHPMTRGTSAACSEDLPTPLEGPTPHENTKTASLGPRSMPDNNGYLVRVHSSSHDPRYEGGILDTFPQPPEFRSPQGCGPEPYEEYFPIPVSKDNSGPNNVRRRRSTKELIKRFESMSVDNSPRAWPAHGTRSTPVRPHRAGTGLSTPPARVEKKTSPLRQSFRNLLSVFKKGRRFGREKYTVPNALGDSEPSSFQKEMPSNPRGEREPDPFTVDTSGLGSRICTSPTHSLHMGPLLYLSVPTSTSSSILPVWITCDAVLHGSHMLLTTATAQGIQSTDVVSLRACMDIKSLAPGEIGVEQRTLLPTMENSANPKVFELIFDGKEDRRFAAPTVKDRAAWVSAIWDTILRNQDRQLRERTEAEITNSLRIDTKLVSSQPALPISPGPDLASRQVLVQEIPFTHSSDSRRREFLPLSEDAPSACSPTSPVAPSSRAGNHSPPEQHSPAKTTSLQRNPMDAWGKDLELIPSPKDKPLPASPQSSYTQSHSPSIVNLGLRSVVRKRLAEMQHHPTMNSSTSHNSRQLPPHTVATLVAREPPGSNLKEVSGLANAVSDINDVGLSATSKQLMSPASSQVASSLGGSDDRLTSPVSVASDPSALPSRPKSVFRLRDEMRDRDSTVPRRHGAPESPLSPSAATSYIDSQADGTIDALLDVMDVHAERQLIKTAELNDQLGAVHIEVRDVAANVHVAISGRERDSRQLAEIHTAVGDVRSTLARLDAKQRYDTPVVVPSDEGLRGNQTQIFTALEEIQEMLRSRTLDNAGGEAKSSVIAGERPSAFLRTSGDTGTEHADLSDIRHKLDMLMELSAHKSNAPSSILPPTGPQLDGLMDSTWSEKLEPEGQAAKPTSNQPHESTMHDTKASMCDSQTQNAVEVLPNDEEKRTQLMEQQAESVRYLNELNTWLETFVNGGTAQITAIADDIQKLRKALGDIDELPDGPEEDASATSTLLQSMRRLDADSQRRDRDSAHLLGTMNGLAAALSEDMRKNAEMRNAYTTESVLGVIERQRQDQERMLRTLANELSNDIRGERLRFVEAMKEATAINVQIHVEEFKKELTREVLISTQEVGRLQRERQLLEQQIADLFAFYSKQKQSVSGGAQPLQPLNPGQEQNHPPSRDRALPLPPPGQKRRS